MAKKEKEVLVVIIHSNPEFHGKIINLPIVGDKKIGSDGEIEVSKELAELLVNGSPSWNYPVDEDEVEDEIEEDEEDEEDNEEEGDEDDAEDSVEDEEDDEDEEEDEEDIDAEDLTAEDGIEILSRFSAAKLKIDAEKEMKITKEDIKSCKNKQDLLDFIHDNWDDIPSEFKEKIA